MKMLFVADLHYALKQFDWLVAHANQYDVVIIGGDLLDLSSPLDIDTQIVVVEKYLNRLRQLTRLVVSSGNHDGDSRNAADESVARWLLEVKMPQLFADGDSIEAGGHLITVCPWWDGPASRAELEAQLAQDAEKPRKRWVWVHHAPPDASPVSWTGKKFAGDEFLLGWIRKFEPDLVLSGHVHNAPFYAVGSWIDRIGKTWVFNPGRQLGPQPTCVAFELERMTAEWISIEGRALRELDVPEATAPPLAAAGA
jgi:Icc-related predicted phosphoesterase